jgi:hypothetical protein
VGLCFAFHFSYFKHALYSFFDSLGASTLDMLFVIQIGKFPWKKMHPFKIAYGKFKSKTLTSRVALSQIVHDARCLRDGHKVISSQVGNATDEIFSRWLFCMVDRVIEYYFLFVVASQVKPTALRYEITVFDWLR